MTTVHFYLYENGALQQSWESVCPVDVGRQEKGEPGPGPFDQSGRRRAIVAPLTSRDVPRHFFEVLALEGGAFELRNQNQRIPLRIERGNLAAGASRKFQGPVNIAIDGSRSIRIVPASVSGQSDHLRTLDHAPLDPNTATLASFLQSAADEAPDKSTPDARRLGQLLRHVVPVVRESATSDSFFQAAAVAAVRIANLDRALVGVFEGERRVFRAEAYRDSLENSEASRLRARAPEVSDTIIQGVEESAVTKIYDSGREDGADAVSLQQLHQAICSPLLDKDRNVIGVLYGDRWVAGWGTSGDVEAQLVEILAGAISAGLARQTEERQRSSMEHFFPEVVARHIVHDASLLEPKEADVSLMFCDVRGFSSISKQLGPDRTIRWMQDVFTTFSECVERERGTVLNYVGDELIAMWGAPELQADHAAACLLAADRMLAAVSELDERWMEVIGRPLRVGIGVHSGRAAVGNTGSRVKFQYGAFGTTVNLASRLQGATKQFGVDVLVSGETARRVKLHRLRELTTIRVVGIEQDIVVYEMSSPHSQQAVVGDAEWADLCKRYAAALNDYRQRRFADATHKLGELLRDFPHDEPCMRLLGLAVAELRSPSDAFSHVDQLTTK